jgi:glycosyltransferase involved in cell wall biosynthesis
MTEAVDVTVVIPVRNGARYLPAALDSVLTQVPAPRQVVVVDDGSTDDTATVLREYTGRIEVILQLPTGQAAAQNRGIRMARSTWISFIDADDEWTPGSLASRWAATLAEPSLELVSGRVVQFVSPELPDDTKVRFKFDPAPSRAQVLGAVLVRKSVFSAVGPLDESLPSAAVIDWVSRVRFAGVRAREIDDVVLRRRLHGENVGVTLDHDVTRQALRDVVRAHNARRKANGAP